MSDQSEGKLVRIEERLDKQLVSTVRFGRTSLVITNLGEAMEFAKLMALSDKMVRKEFRGNPGMCLAVVIQAHDWDMNPYAVASKAYVVGDQVAYEAQLVHAVIENRAPLQGRLRCEFIGDDADRQCRVYGTFIGETEPHDYVSPKFRNIKTKNSPLWQADPDQQLHYYSTRAWARRHCPDVLLGVYTPDETELMPPTEPQGWKTIDNPLGDNPKTVQVEPKNGRRTKATEPKTEDVPTPAADADAGLADTGATEDPEVRDREAEEEQEGREAAAEATQDAPREAKETSKPAEPTKAPNEPKGSPAASQEAPTADVGKPATEPPKGYLQEALATIANAVDAGKLNQWWRGDRNRRLKECAAGELEQLNEVYGEKFIALAKE